MIALSHRRHASATQQLLLAAMLGSLAVNCAKVPDEQQAGTQKAATEVAATLDKAIADQDFDGVRAALTAGASPNSVLASGDPPLTRAVQFGNLSLVRLLLKAGADPNTAEGRRLPPLFTAVGVDRLDIVLALLDAGADPNKRMPVTGALTPLGHAAVMNASDSCDVLIERGADANSWNLWPAVEYDRYSFEVGVVRGRTPLMIAASRGHVRAVTALLVAGADTTLRNEKGKTALDLTNEIPNPTPYIKSMLRNPWRRDLEGPKDGDKPEVR